MTQNELNAALDLQGKINRLKASLDSLHETGGLKGVRSDNTPVMGGEAGTPPGQVAVEIEQEIAELKKQQAIEKVIIQRFIEKQELEDIEQKLLRYRYVECLIWKDVGLCIGYVERHAKRMGHKALKKIQFE